MNILDILAQAQYLPLLPSPTVIAIFGLSLLLGIDVALFVALAIIPSCTVIISIVYSLTEDAIMTASAAAMISIIWIVAFLLRYFRGEKLPSIIPLPEYVKILIMMIIVLLSAFTDTSYIYFHTIYYLITAIVGPLRSLVGTIGLVISTPLLLVIYTLMTSYIMKYIAKAKGSIYIISALAGILILGLSVLTLGVAYEMIRTIKLMLPEIYSYVIYIQFIFALMALFSLSEIRQAFIKLEPEAIAELPVILMLIDQLKYQFIEIYIAINVIILILLLAVNAATIIGFGLGNRRSIISLTCLNNAFLSITLQAYYVFYV